VKIVGAAIGNCVHVAGVQSFLSIARSQGHETEFLGPAVPLNRLFKEVKDRNADIVAVSYRLSPESARKLLDELRYAFQSDKELSRRKYLFGGTPPVARIARDIGMFDAVFDGSEPVSTIISALRGTSDSKAAGVPSSDLLIRVEAAKPFPLIRHHFGLPNIKDTIEGAKKIAESRTLDILSIAPDQNAQESFFRPADMDKDLDGAGGVPIRSPEDLKTIYDATRRGNYPLLRCYSGTRDLSRWADMLKETIGIAWGAVPLMWYSELDGRSRRPLVAAIAENQEAIRHYAELGIPVEVNESHQWALRRCGDTIELAMAYIAAHNARALGVRTYIQQFMFDTPKGISPAMDIAKMLAKQDLLEPLSNHAFRVLRMVRTGLASLSPHSDMAKGQMAASVYSAMTIKPHIVHVVGFSEADHAATAEDVIESCMIARGTIQKALLGTPNPLRDDVVARRKAQLLEETRFLVDAVKRANPRKADDPLADPETLVMAVKDGILDAPDLTGGGVARGVLVTDIVDGACVAIDKSSGTVLDERQRVSALGIGERDLDLAEI